MTLLHYTFFEEKIPDDLFREKLNILPPIFRERVVKFWKWQDAYASLFGKFLLLEGFKNFGISACLSDLRFTKYGKPYLADSSVCFNISHSGNCVVCAMSDDVNSLGVDIEVIKPVNIKGLQSHWTEREWNEIVKGTPKVFFNYWTRKEAVLKADGRGLGIAMKELDVMCPQVNLKEKVYFLSRLDLHNNYVLHIASGKDLDNVIHMQSVGVCR